MTALAFDVAAYTRDPIDLRQRQDADPTGLAPSSLDALAHLWSLERSALDRVRDVLVTPTHADSRVTAFLITWTFEQHALAERLADVLAANGRRAVPSTDTVPGRLRRVWDERAAPTVVAIHSNLLGADVTAAHMLEGWLDAAVTGLLHRRLGAVDPRLAGLAREVDALKTRHLEFFAAQLDTRLSTGPIDSPVAGWGGSIRGARRHARRAVASWRWPGTRYADPRTSRVVTRRLLAGAAGRAEADALDATVSALPGLLGARPVERALATLVVRRRRRRDGSRPWPVPARRA